ncbi:MAG: hypothetical protein PUB22_09475 [Clostridiales bacterium]|nr:hypothetical protein [Clostridiales bacterium]
METLALLSQFVFVAANLSEKVGEHIFGKALDAVLDKMIENPRKKPDADLSGNDLLVWQFCDCLCKAHKETCEIYGWEYSEQAIRQFISSEENAEWSECFSEQKLKQFLKRLVGDEAAEIVTDHVLNTWFRCFQQEVACHLELYNWQSMLTKSVRFEDASSGIQTGEIKSSLSVTKEEAASFVSLWKEVMNSSLPGRDADQKKWGDAIKSCQNLIESILEKMKTGTLYDFTLDLQSYDPETFPAYQCCCSGNPVKEISFEGTELPLFYADLILREADLILGEDYWLRMDSSIYTINNRFVKLERLQSHLKEAKTIIQTGKEDCRWALETGEAVLRAKSSIEKWDRVCCDQLEICGTLLEEVRSGLMINRPDQKNLVSRPVFSGAFDSVLGQEESNLEKLELSAMKHIASGHTILLQGPQIMDNANFLRLLQYEDIRKLCKNGFFVYSAYGNLHTPRDFLMDRLGKTEKSSDQYFKFSSLDAYQNDEYGAALRETVRRALSDRKQYGDFREKIPSEIQNSVEELYESYQLAAECFEEAESMKYHQSAKKRTMKSFINYYSFQSPELSLDTLIDSRLRELEEDEKECSQPGRKEILERFRIIQGQINEEKKRKTAGAWMRSNYYDTLNAWKTETEDFKIQESLELFEKLIDRCYLLFRGFLSCNSVALPETEPRLRLYHSRKDLQKKTKVDYMYDSYKRRSTIPHRSFISWDTLMEQALNIRGIINDPGIPMENQKEKIFQETEITCDFVLDHIGGSLVASEANILTIKKNKVAMTDRKEKDTDIELSHMEVVDVNLEMEG